MNVGYSKGFGNPVDNECCPFCGDNIYISKYYNDFACASHNCILTHGAKALLKDVKVEEINKILKMLED